MLSDIRGNNFGTPTKRFDPRYRIQSCGCTMKICCFVTCLNFNCSMAVKGDERKMTKYLSLFRIYNEFKSINLYCHVCVHSTSFTSSRMWDISNVVLTLLSTTARLSADVCPLWLPAGRDAVLLVACAALGIPPSLHVRQHGMQKEARLDAFRFSCLLSCTKSHKSNSNKKNACGGNMAGILKGKVSSRT